MRTTSCRQRSSARSCGWSSGKRAHDWIAGCLELFTTPGLTRYARGAGAIDAGEHVADAASEAPIQGLSLQAAFEQLDEEQREAVLLVLVEGLSYKEAAGVLNVPIGTVSSRIARGRESLEALLGGREGGLR